jgi:hypothetical protein
LAEIGYVVISSTQGVPAPGAEQKTLITYQAGKESQARALARRLPGNKELALSREPLPAEAVVRIR